MFSQGMRSLVGSASLTASHGIGPREGYVNHLEAIIVDPNAHRCRKQLPLYPFLRSEGLSGPVLASRTSRLEELHRLYFGNDVDDSPGDELASSAQSGQQGR